MKKIKNSGMHNCTPVNSLSVHVVCLKCTDVKNAVSPSVK